MTKPVPPHNRPRTRNKGLPKQPPFRHARRTLSSPNINRVGNRGKTGKKLPPQRRLGSITGNSLVPCNSTNTKLVQVYFSSVHPELYSRLAAGGDYQLYQYEGLSRDIFLIPLKMHYLIKRLVKSYPISHGGIHLGYMRRKLTHTGFERAFYISYEGGEFLYSYMKEFAPDLLDQVQTITLDAEGEKAFLFGRDISFDDVISETEHLRKKKVIFVLDEYQEYIGLSLLMVSQAGANKPDEIRPKKQDDYSRSHNFALRLMNLADAGLFLRKGA